jgi:hypothetical protein
MYHDEHDKKALNALAADMGLHDPANVDAALGLPLVMLGSDATARLNAITENGTKPGQVPSRTDAALSFDDYERARNAEFSAWLALLAIISTPEQHAALAAYSAAVLNSRTVLAAVRIGGGK